MLAAAQSASFTLFLRHLQAGLLPQAVHALGIDVPGVTAQKLRDHAVACTRVGFGELVHAFGQGAILLSFLRTVALPRAWLLEGSACPPLADAEHVLDVAQGIAATRRAQKFPLATSLRKSMSRACSATSFFRRAFFFSSFLEPLDLIAIHAAVLLLPSVDALLGDADLFSGLSDGRTLGGEGLDAAELGDDLFGGVFLLLQRAA